MHEINVKDNRYMRAIKREQDRFLGEEQLNKLSTKRLLAYKRKHLPTPVYPADIPDWQKGEGRCTCDSCMADYPVYDVYRKMYLLVKSILDKREHVGN